MTPGMMLGPSHPPTIATVVVLAGLAAMGLLTTVAALFQSDGTPMRRLAAAERVCVGYRYVSERQVCMHEWLATSQLVAVAAR